MDNDIRTQAEALAARPYLEIAFRDRASEDEYMYVAMTPELEGCIAQGETLSEAKENLRLFRVDYIEHLLENNLMIPEPSSITVQNAETNVELRTFLQTRLIDHVKTIENPSEGQELVNKVVVKAEDDFVELA